MTKKITIIKRPEDGSIELDIGLYQKTVWRGPVNEMDNVADALQSAFHFAFTEQCDASVITDGEG